MDSLSPAPSSLPSGLTVLPDWSRLRNRETMAADAAFYVGIALKSLDDLVRLEAPWSGCWRARQALKCATSAVRLSGRKEDEAGLRDAVLLTAPGDDPGPAGQLFVATLKLSGSSKAVSNAQIKELADLFALQWDEDLAQVCELIETAIQSRRAVPLVPSQTLCSSDGVI